MANLLCVTSGLRGSLNPTLALAGRLGAAGHDVAIACPYDVSEIVRRHGVAYVGLETPTTAALPSRRWKRLLRRRKLLDAAVDALGVGDLADRVRQLAPDAVLVDFELHAHVITLVPVVDRVGLLCPMVATRQHPGVAPMNLSTPPARSGIDRVRIATLWWRLRIDRRRRALQRWWRRGGLDQRSVLRALARRTGFDFRRFTDRWAWQLPFGFKNLPVLHLVPLAFDIPHTPRPGVFHSGPLVDLDRIDVQLVGTDRDRFAEITDRHRRGDDRRLVVMSLSTFAGAQADLVERVVDAVRDEQIEMVVGLGGRTDPHSLGQLPPHVHLFDWIPPLEILPLADAAVLNAGLNSVIECVTCDVPVLVYSLERNDQNGMAMRVEYHGIGIAGHLDDPAERIRDDLLRVLDEPTFRDSVADLRALFAADERGRRAANSVEAMFDLAPPQGVSCATSRGSR